MLINSLQNVTRITNQQLHQQYSYIEILNPNKTCGPDGISDEMLKPLAKEILVPLSILFNRSFREGKFSELWKRSNIIPLPKKGRLLGPIKLSSRLFLEWYRKTTRTHCF